MKIKQMKGGINKMNKLVLTIATLSLIGLLTLSGFIQFVHASNDNSVSSSSSSTSGSRHGEDSNNWGSGSSTDLLIGTMASSSSGDSSSGSSRIPSSSGGGGHGDNDLVKVSLEPGKQVSKDGTATYKVIVKDAHGNKERTEFRYMKYQCYDDSEGELGSETSCKSSKLWREYAEDECENRCSEDSGKCGVNSFSIEEECSAEGSDSHDDRTYKYELEFDSKQDMTGVFEEETIFLKSGETKTFVLEVKTEQKGLHPFIVFVSGEDAKAKTRGLLIVGNDDGTIPPQTGTYFRGEGFIVNYDNSNGRLVNLNLLKDGNKLNGKMKIGNRNLKLKGTASDGKVEFTLFSPKNDNKVGEFNGKITKFDHFLLLKGELSTTSANAIQVWDLTAIGRRKPLFIEIDEAETKENPDITTEVDVDSVVVIGKKALDKKAQELGKKEKYFRIKEVRKGRFLGIFPKFWSNSKEAVIEMFDESGKTTEKTVKAFGETKLEEYTISVGSLENKGIEINIKSK